jgi:membrane-associated protein
MVLGLMDLARKLVDLVLHVDRHLTEIVADCGAWTYAILFLVVFVETGVVVMPFLPGDSLLFAAGAICALPASRLNVHKLALFLFIAAFLGDTANYWIGRRIGPTVFRREDSRWLRRKHLERAHSFFEKYGGRAVILARFVPIVRTFVPFVAGVGAMTYRRFMLYNLVGGFAWVGGFLYLGYSFGNMAVVKKNFGLVIIAIIVLSVLPIVFEVGREWLKRRRAGA